MHALPQDPERHPLFLKSILLGIRNDIVISAFVKELEKSLGRARKGRGSPGREGRVCVWGPRPTEGAPTPRNADGQAPAAGERGGRLTFLGLPEQQRCQLRTVTAWGGEGRERGRLGHPKGRKSRRRNTGTHFTETGTQETGSLRTARLQTARAINTTQTQRTAQVLFSFF